MESMICKHENLKHLPEGKCVLDLPIEERLQYLDPSQDQSNPIFQKSSEEIQQLFFKSQKPNVDQETINKQQETIDSLIKHMTELTNQVNNLTKKLITN
jgi:hypothetical protein